MKTDITRLQVLNGDLTHDQVFALMDENAVLRSEIAKLQVPLASVAERQREADIKTRTAYTRFCREGWTDESPDAEIRSTPLVALANTSEPAPCASCVRLRELEAQLRAVTALTGELTPEVWNRLSRAQGYVRCNENICITPRDAALAAVTINPCLPHAERVRLGLTPADPNYMPKRSNKPNPDTKITQKERNERSFALECLTDDPVRSFTPAELDDMRSRMLHLQSRSTGPAQLQAMRMITLIDQHEHALDLETRVSDALSGDADLEGLEQKITDAEDGITAELDRETDDAIEELFIDQTPSAAHVKAWYAERIAAIREEVTEQIGALNAWRVDAKAALEQF